MSNEESRKYRYEAYKAEYEHEQKFREPIVKYAYWTLTPIILLLVYLNGPVIGQKLSLLVTVPTSWASPSWQPWVLVILLLLLLFALMFVSPFVGYGYVWIIEKLRNSPTEEYAKNLRALAKEAEVIFPTRGPLKTSSATASKKKKKC